MEIKSRSVFSAIKIFSSFFLAFSACILYFEFEAKIKSSRIVVFTQHAQTAIGSANVYVDVSTPRDKVWYESDGQVGAQFDCKVVNKTDKPFTDWEVKIDVPPKYWVDSTWSGQFSFEYTVNPPIPRNHKDTPEYSRQAKGAFNQITITAPETYNRTIDSGDSVSFGMVMYTKGYFNPSHIVVVGRRLYKAADNPLFFVFLFLMIASFIALLVAVATKIVVEYKLRFYAEQKRRNDEIIIQAFRTFANFVDVKDPYTRGHSTRVANYAKELGRRIGLSKDEQEILFWEGLVHDIGKMGIPDGILKKSGKLDEREYFEIKTHTVKGYEILKDFTAIPTLKEIALSHHERWDGNGYTQGLKAEEIPLHARIICVCDAFDAMNSNRCYRPHMQRQQIIDELRKESGLQFDPDLTPVMIRMILDGFVDEIVITDVPVDLDTRPDQQ